MVKPGAVVIDVGVSRVVRPDGTAMTVGDVAFDEVPNLTSNEAITNTCVLSLQSTVTRYAS